MRSLQEIRRSNRMSDDAFENREALVVGFLNDGFKVYLLPEGMDAGDLAEELCLLGGDWHVGGVMVLKVKDGEKT